jgi:signal transduction histidine kinase
MVDGRSQATNVVVRCRRNGDSAIVTVRDTGPGLGTGTEETVFEPFYTTKKDGMGMGLSIVRSILESHGGSIRASNTDSGGASFEFTLPLAVEAQPTPQAVK